MNATSLTKLFKTKHLSPVEHAKEALAKAHKAQRKYNMLSFIDEALTLKDARASESRYMKGETLSATDGVIYSIKDNIAVQGLARRQGSRATSSEPDAFNAPATARLRESGGVFLGKTTMPEFGCKGTSDSPLFGLTRNPFNVERTAGGSSSGAAVLAALGIGNFHVGTDAAGSVRIPAAFCGVVALKSSYGMVPAYPRSVMGDLAHIGGLTQTVDDNRILNNIIGQPDNLDPSMWLKMPVLKRKTQGVKGLKIGFSPRLGYITKVQREVDEATLKAANLFAEMGAIVEQADPDIEESQATLECLWSAGAALALRSFTEKQHALLDPTFLAMAEAGLNYSGADVLNALLRERIALTHKMQAYHKKYDLLLTPQMNTAAIRIGHNSPENGFKGFNWGDNWLEWSRFTYPFNITQQPAIALPSGLDDEGMPLSIQLVGSYGADELVYQAALAFEKAAGFKMPQFDYYQGNRRLK